MNSKEMNKTILKISSAAIFLILISSYVGTNSNAYAIWGHGITHGPSFGHIFDYTYTDGLKIDSRTFDISKFSQSIPTQTLYVNVPSTITLKIFHNVGVQNIQHVALYITNNSNQAVYSNGEWIAYDKGVGLTTNHPNKIFKSVTVSTSLQGHYLYLTFKITPQAPMDTSNIIIKAWDYKTASIQSTVTGALQIIKWQSSLT
ncbi:MAG TPA: hypothetical protein VFG24_08200 [Nitrosopumilaceae archaeon]|nr:hypothetical protein [Nitrosopumilaceae archaeon]